MGDFSDFVASGFQELRDANEGKMAMGAPPIEAPQTEAPQSTAGYEAMVSEVTRSAPEPAMEQSMEH